MSQQLLIHLKNLQKLPPNSRGQTGLCGGLSVESRRKLLVYAQTWKQHSGNLNYPVPHPILTAQKAFLRAKHWEGTYGILREKLMSYLIEYLERQQ